MLHDLSDIPVIDPFATLLALYEVLWLVFRGNAESGSKISREVTHGAIVRWAWAGDASLVRRMQGYPPSAGSTCLRLGPAFFTARSTWPWTSPSSSPPIELPVYRRLGLIRC
jgi:hypothetical protein